MFALGGSAGFCLSFVLCIIGIAVPHTIWLFALALFLGCPASLGFAIGGVCCIACDKTPPPDARHHAGAPPPMAHAVVEMAPLGGAPSSGAVLGQPGAPYGSTKGLPTPGVVVGQGGAMQPPGVVGQGVVVGQGGAMPQFGGAAVGQGVVVGQGGAMPQFGGAAVGQGIVVGQGGVMPPPGAVGQGAVVGQGGVGQGVVPGGVVHGTVASQPHQPYGQPSGATF